ncbi:MAG: ABC transporter permease [Alphaproteobacteria bacterium]|nr:ABC transporter permease [Alphaproteobacteria bacterium]
MRPPYARYAWLAIVIVFIYAPILVVVGASVDPGTYVSTRAFLQFPPNGFSLRWYREIPPELWASLWFSIKIAVLSAVVSAIVGFLAALGLVRGRFPGKALVAAMFRAPLQIPFIVTGVAYLQTFYFVSGHTGFQMHGTLLGLFLGNLFVSIPYTIGAITVSLMRVNPSLEEAALGLGASRWRALRRVTIPLIMPGIYGGTLFAFLITFTEVTISVFLSGRDVVPFSVYVFTSITTDMEPTIPAISTLVFLGSLAMVYLMQRFLGMEVLLRSGGGKS